MGRGARFKVEGLRQRRSKELAALRKFTTEHPDDFERDRLMRERVDRLQFLADSLGPHDDHLELSLRRGEALTSDTVRAGSTGCTMSITGCCVSLLMGAKSLNGSYGSLLCVCGAMASEVMPPI